MASTQILPNSASSLRKQGHLEAGKRRLEEFRKKKAEGRKKAASAGQLQSVDDSHEKLTQEAESNRLLHSNGVSTSEVDTLSSSKLLGVSTFDHNKGNDSATTSTPVSSSVTHTTPPVAATTGNSFYADLVHNRANDHGYPEEVKKHYLDDYVGPLGSINFDGYDQSIDLNPQRLKKGGRSFYQSSHYISDEALTKADEIYSKESSSTSHAPFSSVFTEKPNGDPVQTDVGFASISSNNEYSDPIHTNGKSEDSFSDIGRYSHGVVANGPAIFNLEGRKHSSSLNHEFDINGVTWKSSKTLPTGGSSDFRSSSDHGPVNSTSAILETGSWRTRPSFLDSLNVTRVSSLPQPSFTQLEKADNSLSMSFEVQNMGNLSSSSSKQPFLDSVKVGSFDKLRASNPSSIPRHSLSSLVSVGEEERALTWNVKDSSMKRKQDEDFATLEQHIEDLTQEKFSLQRALDASRTLAESLAAENSSLTNSYNQQGAVVNQLKSDMERLQEEIKAQLLELESFKMEYANAQLECSAADERAKILAAEVIGLEEKALKVRSSELKLERQLENTNSEITSLKKKVHSLQKERQDLQFTIDALQEEKKLLQLKLRKASSSGKSIDATKTLPVVKDMSTSTEDLIVEASNLVCPENNVGLQNISDQEMHDLTTISLSDRSTSEFNLPASYVSIPHDHLRTIDNINSLISELALEKEELVQSLASESSHRTKLQELNKELSRKLEAQTQRLELLTAQSMANDNIPARSTDLQPLHDGAAYTDEGDEVVERVLGWIMKLFPGGPAKRRTSKLL